MARLLRKYQSEIYGNYRKTYIVWGSVAGLALALTMFLHRLLFPSNPPSSPTNYITEVELALALFFVAYYYRASLPNKAVMLKELLLLGIGMGMVSSAVYGLSLWGICGVVFPDMIEGFVEGRIAVMQPNDGDDAMALVRNYSVGVWAFIGAFHTFVFSIMIAFLAAIILRTEKSPLKT